MTGTIGRAMTPAAALRLALAALFALSTLPALACDEECAAGFYFDDAQATCIRLVTA